MTLVAENLSCIRQERIIFSDVSFSLEPHKALWVQGRNGAGKSSLLRIVAQLLKAANGQVFWQGQCTSQEPDQYLKSFEYIGHQDALKSSLTPRENLNFWAQYRGADAVDTAIQSLELTEIADYPVRVLSAGQKKRSNLARLIACPAPLWVLDEPISSLDVHYIDLFRTLLQDHLSKGGMAMLATHQDLNIPAIDSLDLDTLQEAAR
jgi:heme exporter protein A